MNSHQRRKFAKALMDDLRNATDDEKLQGLIDAAEEHLRDEKRISRLEEVIDKLKAERDAMKTLLAESEEDNVRIRSTWTPPEKEFIPYKARGYEVFSDGSVSIGTVKKEKE